MNKSTKSSMNPSFKDCKVTHCRVCGGTRLYPFLSLGTMPIPNGFLTQAELKQKEPQYPLGVLVCEECWLVQLTYVVPAEIMFRNYLYIPSTSATMLSHFQTFAKDTVKQLGLNVGDMVVDVGSNDGTLLGYFKDQEMKVLGIDPASNLAQVARLKGVDTIDSFCTEDVAEQAAKKYGKAKVMTATNVVAHIDNIHDFCNGVEKLLDDDGVLIMEFPYLLDLLDKNEFDTIYHEHLSYFSILPLTHLFAQHNMRIIDVKKMSIHGGSIRVYVTKKKSRRPVQASVKEFLENEKLKKIDKRVAYDDFARRVRVIKRDLVAFLKKLRSQKKKVVGYGAAAKGNVLLNYCKITTDLLDYVVDSISYKQGRYTPGTHLRIYPESRIDKEQPDYVLLLAWNFADEILKKQVAYREKGGQFIITIPYLRIE